MFLFMFKLIVNVFYLILFNIKKMSLQLLYYNTFHFFTILYTKVHFYLIREKLILNNINEIKNCNIKYK